MLYSNEKSGKKIIIKYNGKYSNKKEFTCLVDEEDYDKVIKHTWYLSCSKNQSNDLFYIQRNVKVGGKWTVERMHRMIMNCPKDMQVDHINFNTLDNRKSNLRIVTNRENSAHRKKMGTSKYRGVYFDVERHKWRTDFRGKNGKHVFLGRFDKELDAKEAVENWMSANL